MANYFETRVSYDKTLENGTIKRVTEPYLVDAVSFTEAEALTIKEVSQFISGEFTVKAAKRTNIAEIFNLEAERYYIARVAFITIDERTATEKKSVSAILVGASDFKGAYDNLISGMKGTLAGYEIVSLSETSLTDIIRSESL